MSREGLQALRARVHGDPELAMRLRAAKPEQVVAAVLAAAAAHGDDVTREDCEDAMRRARQEWAQRWIR